MKLEKTTLILTISALLLGTGVYLYETQGKVEQSENINQSQRLFEFTEQEIQRLVIETQSETLAFTKTGDLPFPWQMTEPEATTANDAAVVYLLDLLSKSSSRSSFVATTETLATYGLTDPLATVTVDLVGGETHQLILGKESFDGSSLYAQVDPQEEEPDPEVFLVPKDFQNAVQRDLDEWKAEANALSLVN